MKENAILAYLKRELADFNIDEFLVMIGREELLTHEEKLPPCKALSMGVLDSPSD